MNMIAVGLGGFIGAIFRYIVSQSIDVTSSFPVATLLTNLVGCLLLAYVLSSVTIKWHPHMKLALTTGFFGAFTTFSTFSLDVVRLGQSSGIGMALLYVSASVIGGLGCSVGGFLLAKGGRRA